MMMGHGTENEMGQLGDGTREIRLRPVQVRLP
jgi:hypothetical protein